jgi:hypothetical protein
MAGQEFLDRLQQDVVALVCRERRDGKDDKVLPVQSQLDSPPLDLRLRATGRIRKRGVVDDAQLSARDAKGFRGEVGRGPGDADDPVGAEGQ